MAKQSIQAAVDKAVHRAVAPKPEHVRVATGIRESREIKEPIDFACIDGAALLQIKPDTDSRARLQLALDLLGPASLVLSHSNDEAVDLPWPSAELVAHAVSTAEALLRAEIEGATEEAR